MPDRCSAYCANHSPLPVRRGKIPQQQCVIKIVADKALPLETLVGIASLAREAASSAGSDPCGLASWCDTGQWIVLPGVGIAADASARNVPEPVSGGARPTGNAASGPFLSNPCAIRASRSTISSSLAAFPPLHQRRDRSPGRRQRGSRPAGERRSEDRRSSGYRAIGAGSWSSSSALNGGALAAPSATPPRLASEADRAPVPPQRLLQNC